MRTNPSRVLLTILVQTISCVLVTSFHHSEAFGAVFYAYSQGDEGDADPGDGVALTSEGETTLRAAVEEANALPGLDTINMPGGMPRSEWYVWIWGEMQITDDLVIDGDFDGNYGSCVLQQGDARLLWIAPGVTVTIRFLGLGLGVAERGACVWVSPQAKLTVLSSGINGDAAVEGGAN